MDTLRDGTQVTIRPITPGDMELERRFISDLSPQARRFRFMGSIAVPSDALLHRLTHVEPAREVALIAVAGSGAALREVGAARFSMSGGARAEVAVAVAENWRRRGLATLLMQRLAAAARAHGVKVLYSTDSGSNFAMRGLAQHLGFTHHPDATDPSQVIYELGI